MQSNVGESYIYERENRQKETLIGIEKNGELYFLNEKANYISADNIDFNSTPTKLTESSLVIHLETIFPKKNC